MLSESLSTHRSHASISHFTRRTLSWYLQERKPSLTSPWTRSATPFALQLSCLRQIWSISLTASGVVSRIHDNGIGSMPREDCVWAHQEGACKSSHYGHLAWNLQSFLQAVHKATTSPQLVAKILKGCRGIPCTNIMMFIPKSGIFAAIQQTTDVFLFWVYQDLASHG